MPMNLTKWDFMDKTFNIEMKTIESLFIQFYLISFVRPMKQLTCTTKYPKVVFNCFWKCERSPEAIPTCFFYNISTNNHRVIVGMGYVPLKGVTNENKLSQKSIILFLNA